MAPKKKPFPKEGIRSRRDPRQDRSGRYPRGFNRFGSPITCGCPTPYGPCPQPSAVNGLCDKHQAERQSGRGST